MRSRRVILRVAPYLATFGLIGSTLAWQDLAGHDLGSDLDATPEVVVAEHTVPTVAAEDKPEVAPTQAPTQAPQPEPTTEPTEPTPEPTTEPTTEPQPASGPVVIAEMAPRPVQAFSLVGVTWQKDMPATAEVEVKWHGRDGWSDWTDLHQELAPDEEGRPGTESQWVEWADQVSVRVTNPTPAKPVDIQVATVDPGKTTGIAEAAASQPSIITRKQWGAKPHTTCSNGTYGPSTQGAVIHHTVGSNNYSKSESAKIVRATQAYHMKSRGWCDIGYNFLVDKYGQIFEGRAGGISKQVWAAHAGNTQVNAKTVGVSLMGTFTSTAPSSAMKEATAKLVAWRFRLAKLPAKGTYSIGGKKLNRIAAHRNVLSTECPGSKAYAWLGASGGLRDRVAAILGGAKPKAITGLALTTGSSDAFKATWDSYKGASKYQLIVSLKKSDFSNKLSFKTTSRSYRPTGLKPATTYYVKVRALGSDGMAINPFSAAKSIKTKPAPEPTETPTEEPTPTEPESADKLAAPTGFSIAEKTRTTVKVTWEAVKGAKKYQVQLADSSSMTGARTEPSTDLKERFEDLKPSTHYWVRVRALKADGTPLTKWTKPVRATTTA